MLPIKEFREANGISQRELSLLLGASLQQIKRSETTGSWPNSRLADLYRLQKTLFYQENQVPPAEDEVAPGDSSPIRQEMEKLKEECLFLIRRHERTLAQLKKQYQQATRFYQVLIEFTTRLTEPEPDHLDGLRFLESLLLKKISRTGPVARLTLTIRIKSLKKQIESADDILNGVN